MYGLCVMLASNIVIIIYHCQDYLSIVCLHMFGMGGASEKGHTFITNKIIERDFGNFLVLLSKSKSKTIFFNYENC